MKQYSKLLSILLLVCLLVSCLASCGPDPEPQEPQVEDFVANLSLDMSSTSKKATVTVKSFIDGDTTHFYVSDRSVSSTGIVKARYLAIDTPESTGKIEEWGKRASAFTKEKLSNAQSIIIESDNETWNMDSNDRHLVWVWYRTSADAPYRNLNLEIMQNGLCVTSNSAQNRYGDTMMKAYNQARNQKLYVHSSDKDPQFPYGDAIELTLKELRCNISDYDGLRVAFDAVVIRDDSGSIYVEAYDAETDMYYGISAYYATAGLSTTGMSILTVGNLIRVVGVVSYWETGGTYQITDLRYREMKPSDPLNLQLIEEGHSAANRLTDPETFTQGKVTVIDSEDNEQVFDYAQLALDSSISMEGLKVVDVYTTDNPASSSVGAMTLTCRVNGFTVEIRTTVMRDENGDLITEDTFLGKTIDVTGVVDYYDGNYQIQVFSMNDFYFHD